MTGRRRVLEEESAARANQDDDAATYCFTCFFSSDFWFQLPTLRNSHQNQDSTATARANQDPNAEPSLKPRSVPPAHYIFKIQNFSLLSDAKAECFQSADFEVGGYKCVVCLAQGPILEWGISLNVENRKKWNLSLYPRGNKKKNGDGYISLYLLLSESNRLTFNQEIIVNFKLFVYDYICDNYWTVQDADEKVRRFHGSKKEWGFDKLVSVTDFKDESNGYLVDDCCIFGAEIFVIENANKGECLSMVKKPAANNTYTWTIEKFSQLDSSPKTSQAFTIGGSNWSIVVYPKGDPREKDRSLSIFLKLEDHATFDYGKKLYAEYMLRVRNQLVGQHREWEASCQYGSNTKSWGFSKFMSLVDLNDKLKGFLFNNTLIVEVEFQAMTVRKGLS
ncbi:uncharacterized protein LOC126661589 [Mercurialis annua]|uniref:uncharacterized protein LOC126661589 n=1 Tax=Mercurialis annua TaxID=3986 RepID=UPI0024AEFF03|nr:uncharacterized protein LOC126661589 [Mercurialis annua]